VICMVVWMRVLRENRSGLRCEASRSPFGRDTGVDGPGLGRSADVDDVVDVDVVVINLLYIP
jgi:hypothetical protein